MKRKPICRKCGGKKFRRSGLIPTNPQAHQGAGKGWKGPKNINDGYHKEAVTRLFHRKYVCLKCGCVKKFDN